MRRILLSLMLLLVPAAASPAERAPTVTGGVFDAYLEVRIALRQEAPDLDARVEAVDDPTPLRRALAPYLEREGLAFDHFAQAHRLVSRDAGLKGRVAAILDRHTPASGSRSVRPPADASPRPPSGPARP